MSSSSNNNGRAYEYICLTTLYNEINKIRKANIIKNSSYIASYKAWNSISTLEQEILQVSANAAVDILFELEPLIIERSSDILDLYIQPDTKGEEGDVRDIIISRLDITWEIGLSIKHNNTAVKHPRLSRILDFGKSWYGLPCSNTYWNDVAPIFDYLENQKNKEKLWKELPSKENDVYIPLLKAFIKEIKQAYKIDKSVPKKMVEYLLGEFDFYKVISEDSESMTLIQTYNLRGTLNKPSSEKTSPIKVPIANLPTRIINLDFKPNSSTTVELYLDKGWQFSFRLHNASSRVEQSVKFDVKLVGTPPTIISINCYWKK